MEHIKVTGLSESQKWALEDYRRRFISLGKLSELMGRSAIEVRKWLLEHSISQNNAFSENDAKNA